MADTVQELNRGRYNWISRGSVLEPGEGSWNRDPLRT